MVIIPTMPADSVVNRISAIRGGTMARITYYSALPMKASARDKGYTIYKVTDTTARFGCRYSNLGAVIAKRESPDYVASNRENNNEWVVENRVSYNPKTGKTSIRFATMKSGANSKSVYIVDCGFRSQSMDTLPQNFKDMVIDSYWKRDDNPIVRGVNIESIMSLHNKTIDNK